MDPTRFILGVAGPSGGGKSTFAARLQESLPDGLARHLEHDAYYRDLGGQPLEQRARTNFDHPEALDNQLLVDHLQALRRGEVVAVPDYNFRTHTREGSTEVAPTRIVIVSGVLLLAIAEIRAQLDLSVYVEADLDVCLTRRVQRDVVRGRTPDSVLRQYEESVRPMCLAHVLPSRGTADFVVSGEGELHRPLSALADVLRSRA